MKPENENRPSEFPLILVAPSTGTGERRICRPVRQLVQPRYTDAVIAAGGLPVILPATDRPDVIAEAVRRCDGILMTGGDDINPKLYAPKLAKALAKTSTMHDAKRDLWEKLFDQRDFPPAQAIAQEEYAAGSRC